MNLPAYPRYKPSGVEWLGNVPKHWEVKRLKTSARCWVSNVDKVPAEDELPVRLCNYTDVYYHDYITPDMALMETTATTDEIRRFGLREGDIVITKDSEDWRDIAVPAFMKESAPDLVCGYHLAIIRSNPKCSSAITCFEFFSHVPSISNSKSQQAESRAMACPKPLLVTPGSRFLIATNKR